MTPEILNYLQKIDGGDWSSREMKQELYNLVIKCHNEFKDTELCSVQLGVFAGATLFPMAMAHKFVNNGHVNGIDTWGYAASLDGKNHPDVDMFWRGMDFERIYSEFQTRCQMEEWSGFAAYFRLNTKNAHELFADESVTLLHQDSAHNVETIVAEIKAWSPKIKKGGYWVISAANWGEAVDGYLQLPKYAFKLYKDYDGWEIWQKIDSDRKETPNETVSSPTGSASVDGYSFKIDGESSIISACKESDLGREKGGMYFGDMNVQPIMLYVPDSEKWLGRFERGKNHFKEVGIENIIYVPAIYGEGFGIEGTHEYNLDNPSGHHKIGVANTSLFLSMYMVYNIEMNLPNNHFMFLEDDSRFKTSFVQDLTEQLKYVPEDFDWLFIGHCCSNGKRYRHIGGDVYECFYDHAKKNYPVQFPLGGNCYIVAKKALPKIIETQRDAYVNVDINLALHTFKDLKVYIIRPRMCEQENNNLPI